MLMAMACPRRRPVKSALVNWLPWSVLKISGLPCFASASSTASRQNSTSIVIESRQAKDPAAEPVDHGGEIDEAARHRDVGVAKPPNRVLPPGRYCTQQEGVYLGARCRRRGVRGGVER